MTFDELAAAVLGAIGAPSADVTPSTTFEALELDSLQRAELVAVCDGLGLDLPDDLLATLTSLGDVWAYHDLKVSPAV